MNFQTFLLLLLFFLLKKKEVWYEADELETKLLRLLN